MAQYQIGPNAEANPTVVIKINGVDRSVQVGEPFEADDTLLEVLRQSRFGDDLIEVVPEGGDTLLEADFKTGTYTLEGAASTLLDLFPSASEPVADVGLQAASIDGSGGGFGFGPFVDTPAYDALADGYVVVADIVLEYTAAADAIILTLTHDWQHSPAGDAAWSVSLQVTTDGEAPVASQCQVGDLLGFDTTADAGAVTAVRVAWQMSDALLAASLNGGGAVAYVPMENLSRNRNSWVAEAYTTGLTEASITLERVTFYPLSVLDDQALEELSALA